MNTSYIQKHAEQSIPETQKQAVKAWWNAFVEKHKEIINSFEGD